MTSTLTCIIPNLLACKQGLSVEMPNLSRFLKKATPKNLESMALPFNAAFSAIADDLPAEQGAWLFADPICCRVDWQHVFILGTAPLELSKAESAAWIEEINAFLKDDPLRFWLGKSGRWYLQAQTLPSASFTALPNIIGKDMRLHMPKNGDANQWTRLLTELQMLLHQSKLNQKRTANAKPTVSSVWFWGAGQLNQNDPFPWDSIITDDAGIEACAKYKKIKCEALTENFSLESNNRLLMLTEFENIFFADDAEKTKSQLIQYDQIIFKYLLTALQKRKIKKITLILGDGSQYTIQKKRWFFF